MLARYNRQGKRATHKKLLACCYDQAVTDDILAQIRAVAKRRQRRQDAFEQTDTELRELVRQAFAEGHGGPELAKAAGLSVPRVYQIRDGRR